MLRSIRKFLWRFMVIFSFIVNIVLVVVLIALGLFIFDIKANIADPLVQGLHSTAKGLDNATIDWTIPVRDTIQVDLTIPLQTNTEVVLTAPVPLTGLSAKIDLPGINAYNVDAVVNLTLPQGLTLPVALDLNVEVDEPLDVALDVRAIIPLSQTQLHDPIDTLGLLFEPLAVALHNLPADFGQAGNFVTALLSGSKPVEQLLFDQNGQGFNSEAYVPWAGYSLTAGLGYDLLGVPVPPENVARPTGIVAPGGIPALDAIIRPQYYQNGQSPEAINSQAINSLSAQGILNSSYNGTMAAQYITSQVQNQPRTPSTTDTTAPDSTVPAVGGSTLDDPGIMPTPTSP